MAHEPFLAVADGSAPDSCATSWTSPGYLVRE
jgi:hypothetical protein